MKRFIVPTLGVLFAAALSSSEARAGVSVGISINDHFPHIPVPHVVVTPPRVVVAPPPVIVSRPPVVCEPPPRVIVRECDRYDYRPHRHMPPPHSRHYRYDDRYDDRHDRRGYGYGHRR